MSGVLDADAHAAEPLRLWEHPDPERRLPSARPVDKILSDPNALYGVS